LREEADGHTSTGACLKGSDECTARSSSGFRARLSPSTMGCHWLALGGTGSTDAPRAMAEPSTAATMPRMDL